MFKSFHGNGFRYSFFRQSFDTMSMTTSANLYGEVLHERGIDSVAVEFQVERVHRESYHRAGPIEEIIEVVPLDGCINPKEKLEELVLESGYESTELFLWEMWDDKLHDVACEEGAEMEAARYSDYMARRAESDWE